MTTEVLGQHVFSEVPTVLGTEVMLNGGGIPVFSSGDTASFPAAGIAGQIYLDITVNRFYRDTGSAWIDLTPLLLLDGTANQINVVDGTNVTASIVSLAPNLIMPGTEGFVPPSGTTAQRPATPVAGQSRFNTSFGWNEEFDGSNWAPMGRVIQCVTGTIAAASGTTAIPLDNTLPLSTEGIQIWTQSFTPLSTSSRIIINFSIHASNSGSNTTPIVCVFDGTTNIGATAGRIPTANTGTVLSINKVYAPGSITPITFSARLGCQAGTTYCNRIGNTTLGGALVSNYIITEIQ